MALKALHLPAIIITAVLCLLGGVGAAGPTVQVKQGGSALLFCPLTLPDEVSSRLHVVEWFRQGYDVPVLIKFGAHPPRVHPKYEGRVTLVGGTSLRLKDLILEDNGWYECRILLLDRPSDEGRNGSWTFLSVTAPPVFSETPPPITEALLHQRTTLKCVARGNPPPTITWFKNGVPINKTKGVTVLNGSLTFSSANRHTAGQYQCQASNNQGHQIHSTQLRVKGPPVILIPPKDTVLNMSHNALLQCQAEADPPNMTYVWMKERENIYHIESLKSRVKVLVDGTLLISRLIPADSGNYTCMPTNSLPSPPTASAVLTVQHPAQVTHMPKRILLPTGQRGVISCPLVAEPPLLRVDWTKNGKALDLNAYPGWILAADGSIVITTANDDAVGVYTCTPYNSYGTMGQSDLTNVVLQDPPSFTIPPSKEYRVEVGKMLIIPCRANGDPQPTITWTKLGAGVSRSQYSVAVDGSLLLQSLSKEHYGVWECSATNGISTITATTSITVIGTSPHAVSSVSVEPGVNQVNMTWVPGYDGGYTQSFTVWLKCVCSEEDQQEWRSFPGSSSSPAMAVNGLLPSTEYQFSVMAQNKLGSGPFSNITTARTMDELPTPSKLDPPALLFFNQTSEGVYLRWATPSPQQPPIDDFILQSRQDDRDWSNLSEGINANKSEMLVKGLQKNSNYELRLLSRRGEQLSEPSRSINVTTLVDTLPPGSRLPEMIPQPLWTGVMAGMGALCLILLLALAAVCLVARRRSWRRRKATEDHPDASMKHDSAPGSPDSALKEKLLPLRPLSSSSSSSEHSTLGRSTRNDQREHLLPRSHAPSKSSLAGSHLHRSSTVELIHRGPDGRFMMESCEEDSPADPGPTRPKKQRQDLPRLSERAGGGNLRKSQSLRSYRSECRDPPFVVSVDMPACGLDILSSGRARTLPNRGCYSVSQGQEISDRSSLCSEISSTVLYPPSETYSSIKCGAAPSTASTLLLQMEHEREQGNLNHCLRLAREREELERELRRYAVNQELPVSFVSRGGSLRVERKRDIGENEEPSWTSRGTGSLHVRQLPSRGQCLPSSPIVRASSCIPWESGHILSASNLMQAHNSHERAGMRAFDFSQLSNQRRSKSLEQGMHQRSHVIDQRRRQTTEGVPVIFNDKTLYPVTERAYYPVEGSLQNTGACNRQEQNIMPRASHLGGNHQERKAERNASDYVEMSVDEPEEQARAKCTKSILGQKNDSLDCHRPSLYQLERASPTVIEVGYRTIQRGTRRDLDRLSSRSSRTLPSKHGQRPIPYKGLSVSSQHVNHHKSAPSLNSKKYKEQFLPPDAWIDSLTMGQNSSLSPIPSRPSSLAEEETHPANSEATEVDVASEIQLQDSHQQGISNNPGARTTDQSSHQHMVSQHPPSMRLEDSSWPLFHCYSPEPEGSCRSYASQSSGRGSLDHPSSRQSLSFSPPLTSSLEPNEESDRDESCFRRDSVDENYEWDSQSVSMQPNALKTSITPINLEAEILNKERQRNVLMERRLALKQQRKVLYSPAGMLPPSCEESLLEQEIQHGSTCYPDINGEGVLF